MLPKDYARPALDKQRLGELIDLIGTIGLGDAENRSKDILGRVYEYFLGQFASAEGKKGGQFYTPRCVVRLLVEMLAPVQGPRLRPLLRLRRHVRAEREVRRGARRAASATSAIYGQESNPTTWRLAKMNLAIRGIEANLGPEHADSFHHDLHKDLKADFILANPPFNMSDWGGDRLRDDVRWKYGVPPVGNANFAWVQHFIHHLAPTGMAGFVLANGSHVLEPVRRGRDPQGHRRGRPGGLHGRAAGPALLLDADSGLPVVPRAGQEAGSGSATAAARRCSSMPEAGHDDRPRSHRELTDEDIAKIAGTYHAWRGDKGAGKYEDVPGFCKARSSTRSASTATC